MARVDRMGVTVGPVRGRNWCWPDGARQATYVVEWRVQRPNDPGAGALSEGGERDTVESLLLLSRSSSWADRETAVHGLARFTDGAAVRDRLVEMLDDQYENITMDAARALITYGGPLGAELVFTSLAPGFAATDPTDPTDREIEVAEAIFEEMTRIAFDGFPVREVAQQVSSNEHLAQEIRDAAGKAAASLSPNPGADPTVPPADWPELSSKDQVP